MRKLGKATTSKLRRKADQLMGMIVRSRGICQARGLDKVHCGGSLQWCHIITRSNYRLRHEPLNALCLCSGHHVYYTNHPWEWHELIEIHFPKQFEFISEHKNELLTGTVPHYEELVTNLNDFLTHQSPAEALTREKVTSDP